MRKVVSFSGGRTSAYLCKIMIDEFGSENVDFIYMDTGAEHTKTYEFIRKVNRHLGLNLICLRGDFDQPLGQGHKFKVVGIDEIGPDLIPYKELVHKYGTPGVTSGWCTSRMKEETHDKYCDDKYGEKNYETWVGIRADEPSRVLGKILGAKWKSRGLDAYQLTITLQHLELDHPIVNGIEDIYQEIKERMAGKFDNRLRYMAEITDFEKQDVINFWRRQPFDLEIEEWLGNCVFCFKKSNLKLAAAAKDKPEMYQEWLNLIDRATEREGQNRESRHVMYRSSSTLPQVIATFDGSTGQEIKARIRGGHHIDTNSCSESCEVFSD